MLAVLGHCSSPATCSHPICIHAPCNALPAIALHHLYIYLLFNIILLSVHDAIAFSTGTPVPLLPIAYLCAQVEFDP